MPHSETPAPGTPDPGTVPGALAVDLPHGQHVEALTWGPETGPLAVLLHGFPDTAHTWRHLGPALAQDGWRVVQFPQQHPAHPGMEYNTSYLKYEYILEKMEQIDGG